MSLGPVPGPITSSLISTHLARQHGTRDHGKFPQKCHFKTCSAKRHKCTHRNLKNNSKVSSFLLVFASGVDGCRGQWSVDPILAFIDLLA